MFANPRPALAPVARRRINQKTTLMIVAALPHALRVWRQRRHRRRALAKLDERLLRDIGESRADADLEIAKWFWEA